MHHSTLGQSDTQDFKHWVEYSDQKYLCLATNCMYLTVELQSPFLFLKHRPLSTDGQWYLRVHLWAHTYDGAKKPDAAGTQAQQEGKPWHGTFSLDIYQNSLSGLYRLLQNRIKFTAVILKIKSQNYSALYNLLAPYQISFQYATFWI